MGIGAVGRAVFLDRDGVINESVMRHGKPYPPHSADEVRVVADAASALARLKSLGLRLIVVTNQPDVARGTLTAEAVEGIHRRLGSELPIDEFLACFHDDQDHCSCRKPKPGMILEGAARWGVEPGAQLYGGRPLARHRSRAGGGVPDYLDRPRISRARPEAGARRARRFVKRGRRKDCEANRR